MSAPPALHVQPLNGPCAFLLHSWLIPCGTLLLRCIYLRFGLFMWIKDSPTHWRTAFSFKELSEESSVLRARYLLIHVYQFWAACLLAYFGFLRSAEFTVPSLSAFNPSRHLSVRDIAVDVPLNPSCLQICIKASKTDPFRKGCNILIGPGSPPLCAVQAVVSFLERRGNRPGPLFLFENGLPLSRSLLTDRLRAILLSAGLPGNFSSQFLNWGSHFCCKGWYSRSPHPSFGPLGK